MGCCGSAEQPTKPQNNKYVAKDDENDQKNKTADIQQQKQIQPKDKISSDNTTQKQPEPSNNPSVNNNNSSNTNASPPNTPPPQTTEKPTAVPKLGSSMNSSGRGGAGGLSFSSSAQRHAFGSNTMKTSMTHRCNDYLPGMQGNFICDAFCQQRNEEDGGTVWGGGDEVAIDLVPFKEQMKDNKNEYTAAAFKALMSTSGDDEPFIRASLASPNNNNNRNDGQKGTSPQGSPRRTHHHHHQPMRKIYAAASCVCRAALHAGVISNEPDDNGEQQPQSFSVVALARTPEDAAALKAPLNDYEARERYVKYAQNVATLPEVQGALLVRKEWPSETIAGSMGNGVQSHDVSNVVSKWICFV